MPRVILEDVPLMFYLGVGVRLIVKHSMMCWGTVTAFHVVHGWHVTRRLACRSGWCIRKDVRVLFGLIRLITKKVTIMAFLFLLKSYISLRMIVHIICVFIIPPPPCIGHDLEIQIMDIMVYSAEFIDIASMFDE